MNTDVIAATADLVARSGAVDFQIGYLHDDVPVEDAAWWASASFKGTRIQADEHKSPTAAALALAERLLDGATCRCKQTVTLRNTGDGCRWRLMGERWEPGCDAEPIHIKGRRGDIAAMRAALDEHDPRSPT